MPRRHRIPVAVLLLALAAAVGCRRAKPATDRPVSLGQQSEVVTLDPTFADGSTFSALSNVFDGLVSYDGEMRLRPGLAATWKTPDEKTWLLELRPDVLFHDGTKLLASDVVKALERARHDPDSEVQSKVWSIAEVTAPDDRTVKITTSKSNALLLHELTNVLIAKGATRQEIEERPLGTGAYRVAGWERGAAVALEAFPQHWNGAPPISRITFVTSGEGDVAVQALERGKVDVTLVPARTILQRSNVSFTVRDSLGLSTQYLYLNTLPSAGRKSPLTNRRVRQAMSLAVDRRKIARAATGHEETFAAQPVPKTVFGYAANLPPPLFDPARARQLLAEAGYPAGFDIVLAHRRGVETEKLAGKLKEMLEAVGIRITLQPMRWPEMIDRMGGDDRPLDLFIGGWNFDTGDAGSFLRDCLRSRNLEERAGLFNWGYSNPEMDLLIDESTAAFNAPSRLVRFEKVMKLAAEEVPLIPLYNEPDIWGVARDLAWKPRIDGRLLAAEMSLEPPPY